MNQNVHKAQGTTCVGHTDTPYGVCVRAVCTLACLTTSDSPVVKLCGTPSTQGIQTCLSLQESEGEESSTIADAEAGYQEGSGLRLGASRGQRHAPTA